MPSIKRLEQQMLIEDLEAPQDTFPTHISPMLAYLVKEPFDRKGWVFEIKWDGYRAITKIQNSLVSVCSRNQRSFNGRFPQIVEALQKLKVKTAILDGEIVVVDDLGRSRFQLIQNFQKTQKGNLFYYLFDILYLNGRDLRPLPLIERKQILQKLFDTSTPSCLRFSDHIEEKGKAFFKEAVKKNLEGIMGKNGKSPYQEKRSRDWIKVKVHIRQEVVIGGYTQPRGNRIKFGALLVGVYDGNFLRYVGHVGGGFNRQLLTDIYSQLEPLETEKCPFQVPPKANAKVTWVKPKLVCEVSFAEWTQEEIMRQPIFQGLRTDKNPRSVKYERFYL